MNLFHSELDEGAKLRVSVVQWSFSQVNETDVKRKTAELFSYGTLQLDPHIHMCNSLIVIAFPTMLSICIRERVLNETQSTEQLTSDAR